ncbi:alkaline phosphatase, partial [Pseudoalteromonas sp. S409]
GKGAFNDISGDTPIYIKNVTSGFLPDMVTFSHDGVKVVVANEGEPNGDYSTQGSISIIIVNDGEVAYTATNIDFTASNDKQADLEAILLVFANP